VMASACVTTRAQAPAVRMPALEVPPVPPRVIEPAPPPPAPLPEPVEPLPKEVPPSAAKARPQQKENQKPEPKPPETTPVEQPAVASAAAAPPVPPLRTTRTGDSAQAERQIKDTLYRANDLLSKVDFGKLTAERQKVYNQAKQFILMAEAASRDAKFEYALEVAEKAETLAKELQS
jgi:outer membrane biosynthesis protein TonB